MNTHIEPLESRIAPAVVFVNAQTVTYDDGDGDKVTVRISKGAFENPNTPGQTTWFFGAPLTGIAGREQLEVLDLSFLTALDGANLSISAVPTAAGGDGTVSIGHIDARGIDLGSVAVRGDLGAIDAGDAVLSDGGLKSLSVFSLGGEGLTTGAPDLISNVVGSVGSIRVLGDIAGAEVSITGTNASLGSLTVGGSIFGGTGNNSGSVAVEGAIPVVKIGGDLLGGSGSGSGSITGGRFGTVTIGGSIYGNAGENSGQIFAFGALAKIVVGGDLLGGDGEASGLISADAIGTVALDGSLLGGLGASSGRIESGGNLTTLRIGGSVVGGSLFGVGSEKSGSIFANGKLASAVIAGNLRGGNAEAGFTNNETGYIEAGSIGALTIGGSLIGGSDNGGDLIDSGTIRAFGSIGSLVIKGGVFGGDSSSGGTTNGSAYIEADRLLAVTINGSVVAGSDAGELSNSGAIRALHDIGTLTVKGSLEGSDTHPVIISAVGQVTPTATVDLAMRSVTVLGRVFQAEILAGYGPDTTNSIFGQALNADAQIGVVKTGGDWIASDLIAGLATASGVSDGFFGDAADAKINITGVTGGRDTAAISRIASIVIGGRVLGDTGGGAIRNGFGAQFVGSMKVGGTAAIPLFAGAGNDTFGGGEYPLGQTVGTFNPLGFNVHVFEVAVV
jgi:hypothetical protein